MTTLDYFCIIVYLSVVIILGSSFARGKDSKTTGNYFLAGKSIKWLPLSISMYASIFSAITFVMAPAEAFRGDLQYLISLIMFPIASVFGIIFFIDVYTRLKLTTIYEYIEVRYSRFLSYIALTVFLLFRSLYAGIVVFTLSMVLHVTIGFPLIETMVGVGVGAIIYTTLGGMKAVIWTDVIQFFVIIIGLTVTLIYASISVPGGGAEIQEVAREAGKLRMADFSIDLTKRYVFWTLIIYGFVEFLGAKTVDQMNVQRYLSATSPRHAKLAMLLQSFFSIPVWLLLFAVGMALFAYYHHNPSSVIDSYISEGMYDRIFPYFISSALPSGVRGLLIAALLAAAMSTMDSVLNALSAITIVNIYQKLKPDATDRQSFQMAKLLTVIWGIVVIFIAIAMIDITSILKTIQSISGILMGPLLGVLVLGLFTKSSNHQGVLIGLITSLIPLVIIKYGASLVEGLGPTMGINTVPDWLIYLSELTFTVYGLIGVTISSAVGYVASRLFSKPELERIEPLIWKKRPLKDMLFGDQNHITDIKSLMK